MVHRAVDLGIDLQLLQQKWAVVAPSLTALVSEYRPQENENVTKNR